MCGRYRLTRSQKQLQERFDSYGDVEVSPRYNIAPSQPVIVIRQDAAKPVRTFSTMRWGLLPAWAKDMSIGYKTINARAETVATMASFREPLRSQRCLIPVDGFYEWQKNGKTKQPYCFEVNDGEMFAFAGLWDRWRKPQGVVIESCTILTTTSNSLLAGIHDRMPVILKPDSYDLWLDPGFRNTDSVLEMLAPFDSALMRCYPVSTRVNNVQNDDADCARRLEPQGIPTQTQLF
jgi:putative SOS response-associated peptidase YedK